jgi:hypothetical protein
MMSIIKINPREIRLKKSIRAHLQAIGFSRANDGTLIPPSLDKESYRKIHSCQRMEKINEHRTWIADHWPKLSQYFASGGDIEVKSITPRLEVIQGGTWQSDLFRLASLYWQIPVSVGFGRRIRFLVWDDYNEKLIGIFALGDAVFNLKVRDELIGWDHYRRADFLVNMMDAYVLGALPPYNMIMCGKLVACLIPTKEVVTIFKTKYSDSIGIISKKKKNPQLVAVSTSSAFGRSSLYNRLKLDDRWIFKPIGYTAGCGHFHISDSLFDSMRDYLKYMQDDYADSHQFGSGPNWRFRVIRKTLTLLGMNPDIIRHGFTREVFFCPIANNAINFLNGNVKKPSYKNLMDVKRMTQLAIERWVYPRSVRQPFFRQWDANDLLNSIVTDTEQLPFMESKIGLGK